MQKKIVLFLQKLKQTKKQDRGNEDVLKKDDLKGKSKTFYIFAIAGLWILVIYIIFYLEAAF